MSASSGLVKFKRTGNIYMCCYEGTSDVMIPYIFLPEECLKNGYYCPISYGRKLGNENDWETPNVKDIDDIEIYSDYGDGFYWTGKGSESVKFIISGNDFYNIYNYTSGTPKWVTDFWDKIQKN